ncbi:MAG: hypothetical protein ACYTBV_17470 [Planctomycetota bacterium]
MKNRVLSNFVLFSVVWILVVLSLSGCGRTEISTVSIFDLTDGKAISTISGFRTVP